MLSLWAGGKLLVDAGGIIGKSCLEFRILAEVGIFLHANLASNLVERLALLFKSADLLIQVTKIIAKAPQVGPSTEFEMTRNCVLDGKTENVIESLDPVCGAADVHRRRRPVEK